MDLPLELCTYAFPLIKLNAARIFMGLAPTRGFTQTTIYMMCMCVCMYRRVCRKHERERRCAIGSFSDNRQDARRVTIANHNGKPQMRTTGSMQVARRERESSAPALLLYQAFPFFSLSTPRANYSVGKTKTKTYSSIVSSAQFYTRRNVFPQ